MPNYRKKFSSEQGRHVKLNNNYTAIFDRVEFEIGLRTTHMFSNGSVWLVARHGRYVQLQTKRYKWDLTPSAGHGQVAVEMDASSINLVLKMFETEMPAAVKVSAFMTDLEITPYTSEGWWWL